MYPRTVVKDHIVANMRAFPRKTRAVFAGARFTASAQAQRHIHAVGEDAAAEAAAVARLAAGIKFEQEKGHVNWPGTSQLFSAFLEDMITSIAAKPLTGSGALSQLASLQAKARKYGVMPVDERARMLREVTALITSLQDVPAPAPVPVPAPIVKEHGPPAAPPRESRPATSVPQNLVSPPIHDVCTQYVPIIFDCETTDVFAREAQVVELAARSVLSGNAFTSFVRLADNKSMSKGAELVTGLTTAAMRDPSLPTFTSVYTRFLKFIEDEVALHGSGAAPLLVGHNIRRYDLPLLIYRARDADLPILHEAQFLDTLDMARRVVPGLKTYKLTCLTQHFSGSEPSTAHRAAADVEANELVLRALVTAATQASDGVTPFSDPPALKAWCGGRVGDLPAAAPVSKRAPKKSSAVLSGGQFGRGSPAMGVPLPPPSPPAAVRAELSGMKSSTTISEEDEFSAEIWAADDPLAEVEAEGLGEGVPSSPAELALTIDSWRALVLTREAAQCFITQPVEEVTGRHKFTPNQLKDLAAAGMPRLIDVLECFPRGYSSAPVGSLPEASNLEEEQAVCLVVKLLDIKVRLGPGGAWGSLVADLKVVDPATVGLPRLQDGGIGGSPRDVRLQYRIYRKGRSTRWALSNEEATIRRQGEIFGVAGRVQPATPAGSSNNADAWVLKEGSVDFMQMTEVADLAAAGGDHIRVSYSKRGTVLPQRMAPLVNKAMRALQDASARGNWNDPVPEEIRREHGLMGYAEALEGMHNPSSPTHYEQSRLCLAFQELFYLQLKLLLQRATMQMASSRDQKGTKSPPISMMDWSLAAMARRALPFTLTGAQERALALVREGMAGWPPMMCLLQGDVGCGKTVVAFLSCLATVGSGYQAAIMAPTEILAEQHFKSLSRLLESSEVPPGKTLPKVALLTGSTPRAERVNILAGLQDGSINIIVGTHALISAPVVFSCLGLAIIDEQHKFGVQQRAKLLAKASPSPHILSMSATPIPRSIALVLHGELTLVTVDEVPPGRTPVATRVVQDSAEARKELYTRVRHEVAEGGQVYIVCPLVDKAPSSASEGEGSSNEGEAPGDAVAALKAAVVERDRLVAEGELLASQCSVLHGRMSSQDKEAALAAFSSGEVPVLISTTVVEVGVDVPTASMMVVEHADRFGLAQLHQLRGRVGRGKRASSCFLMSDRSGAELERLRVLERSSSGFDVAEADFAMRGAGEMLGKRQSGRNNMGELKVCQLPQDAMVLELARKAAALYLARTGSHPQRWSKELVAAVVDPALIDLDLAELPSMQ